MNHTVLSGPRLDFSDTVQAIGRNDALSKVAGQSTVLNLLPEQHLGRLLQRSAVRKLPERHIIFRRADRASTVILILEGYVKLSSVTACGREVVLEIAGPGACFGELSVLNGSPPNSDATTITASRLLLMDGRKFWQTMERHPPMAVAIFSLTSERLRAATRQVLDIVALPAPARVAKTLLQLAEMHSHLTRDGICIDLRLSQSELGGIAGLTRESIN
jgi:CRP/FNR family cyclic AMP-dependent transcriptional regulator